MHTSRQMRRHLLCRGCEQRFNDGGERWIAAHCARTSVKSRIQLALESAQPFYSSPVAKVYASNEVTDIDADRIIYFALSVFWRAAVADWEGQPLLTLGRYEYELATYLLGQSKFPRSAGLVVTINDASNTLLSMIAPHGKRESGYHQYGFFILGMTFDLFLGGKLPHWIVESSCIATAPQRPIFLASTSRDAVRNAYMQLLGKNPSDVL